MESMGLFISSCMFMIGLVQLIIRLQDRNKK